MDLIKICIVAHFMIILIFSFYLCGVGPFTDKNDTRLAGNEILKQNVLFVMKIMMVVVLFEVVSVHTYKSIYCGSSSTRIIKRTNTYGYFGIHIFPCPGRKCFVF